MMNIALKLGAVLLLVGVVIAIGVVTWQPATPAGPSFDAEAAQAGEGGETGGETGDQDGDVAFDPSACYRGEWVGCWRLQDDQTGQRKPVEVTADGCRILNPGFNRTFHFVYAYTLGQREKLGPPERSFTAPVGSVVYYMIPASNTSPDLVGLVESRADPETGRLDPENEFFWGWAILSTSPAGQRTIATVFKGEHQTPETLAKPVAEYRLVRTECE